MLGDTFRFSDGAVVTVHHFVGRDGLVHAALSTNGDRMYAPQHGEGPSSPLFHAVETRDEVLTCLVCATHVFQKEPSYCDFSYEEDSYGGPMSDDDD